MTQERSAKQALIKAEQRQDPVWAAAQALVEDYAPALSAQPAAWDLYHWVNKLGIFITRLEWDQCEWVYQQEVAHRVESFRHSFSQVPLEDKMECLVSFEGLQAEQLLLTAVFPGFEKDARIFSGND